MEWLKQEAMTTAERDVCPTLWKRYVDDILEIVKCGSVQQLTDHLNAVDTTQSIKFTYEEEKEEKIPFLDTVNIKKEDGALKLKV